MRAVVTQNIDRLHERAGSRDVVEVHGSIRTSSCLACGAVYPFDEVVPLIERDGAPGCPACGAVLKPDVVFFDELLPVAAVDRARALVCEAGLLVVVGSSLEVFPVGGLPQETLDAGGAVAVVNLTPTWVDPHAELVVRERAGDALAEALARLTPRDPVVLAEPDPAWETLAAAEAGRVREALGAEEVEHVGSTAVPGLAAKPIVDLMAGLAPLAIEPEQIRGEFGLPGRVYFRAPDRHVHAVELGGDHWVRHLALRDYLRAHPEEAAAYTEEKRRALAASGGDGERYWTEKALFVEALEQRALAWAVS